MSEQMNDKDTMTIEEGFSLLEELIGKMEEPEVSLEESFALYNKGIKLVKECNDKIDYVEKQIKLIEGTEESGEF